MPRPIKLSLDEITPAFAAEPWATQYPPILTLQQFAKLFGVSTRTARSWISAGDFDGATTRVGKHRRIWRDRAIQIAFGRTTPKARNHDHHSLSKGEHPNDEDHIAD